jgi:lipoate-protein ligase A
MRVYRGWTNRPETDRELTARLVEGAADGVPGVRVWAPPRQVAFGRRDARASGYDRAKRAAERAGLRPIERDVGGRAVAYTGDTLAFAVAVPTDGERQGIDDRYTSAARTVRSALSGLDAAVIEGEPPRSFCPGAHSLRVVDGGKLAGIAQRVRSDAALVAGCLIVTRSDAAEIASALDPVYDALGVEFDPGSVGSVAGAGGPSDARRVARAIERAFIDDVDAPVDPADGPAAVADRSVGSSVEEPERIERVGSESW